MPTQRTAKELKGDIQKAVQILELFTDPSKGRDVQMLIPPSVLREAHGIVFIRLYRIGFMLSAKSGTGIIIARLPDGSWSAPSGVSMSSVGFGHQAGGQVIDSIIVMNYRAAVKAFFDGGGQLQLGVGASLAVGPMGRAADISTSASSTSHIAATYAYSASKGLYIGYSFEGSKISERVNTNAAYYGRPISARDILTGVVPPSPDAARLYDILNSLGAGPRPGLPFASQRDKRAQSASMQQSPPVNQTHAGATMPPPINYGNRPPTTADGFEEPPPPYQPDEGGSQQKNNNNNNNNTTPFRQSNTNSNNNTSGFTDTKTPMMDPANQQQQHSTNSFHRADMQPGQSNSYFQSSAPSDTNYFDKGKQPSSFSRGDMQPGHQENNALYASSAPSSSSAQPATRGIGHNTEQPFSSDKKRPLPSTENDVMTVVVAKYDYHGDSPSDLNFSAGDHIIVTKRLDDRESWWEGEIGERRGFFPANYTEELS